MRTFIQYSFIVFISITFIACSDNEVKPDPTAGLTKIGEGYALGAGAKVELWAKEGLFAGFNNLYVALYDSSNSERITEGHVHFIPTMIMDGGMQHNCPVINPSDEKAVDELFLGAAFFIMPSGNMGFWDMAVSVHNHHNGKFGKASFRIEVATPATTRMRSFVAASGKKVFVSYNFPHKTKVGVNDIELAVYEMLSGSEFVPVADFQVSLTPEMPSMDHGSPNNVDPVYEADGRYHGKVNFTMTGTWRLNFNLSRAGDSPQALFFDVMLN
jgi:hypothetical protein